MGLFEDQLALLVRSYELISILILSKFIMFVQHCTDSDQKNAAAMSRYDGQKDVIEIFTY